MVCKKSRRKELEGKDGMSDLRTSLKKLRIMFKNMLAQMHLNLIFLIAI
jgi:hypothetical protein